MDQQCDLLTDKEQLAYASGYRISIRGLRNPMHKSNTNSKWRVKKKPPTVDHAFFLNCYSNHRLYRTLNRHLPPAYTFLRQFV